MSAPAPAPSAFAAVLSKLNAALGGSPNDPSNTALMGFAQGLGQASAPHMLTPVSGGQALSMAQAASQQYQSRALANQLQSTALIPYQTARAHIASNAASGAMFAFSPAEQAAIKSGQFTPALIAKASNIAAQLKILGVDPNSVPYIREALTWAQNRMTPFNQPPGSITTSASQAATGGAPAPHGALPEGSRLTPGGTVAPMGNVPLVIAANAYDRSGGAAAGAYPVNAALSYHVRPPGTAGGTLAPPPGPFVPATAPGSSASPSPAAIQAAIAAARQRQMGMMQGVQATGGQLPGMPPQAPTPPSTGGMGQNSAPLGTPASAREIAATPAGRAHAAAVLRAANARPLLTLPQQSSPGNGLMSPGMSPGALAAAKSVGNQTGAAVGEAAHVSDAARQQIGLYDQMGQALSQMGPTGAWRDVSTPLGKLFNYFGFKPFQITSAAEFAKFRAQLVGAATHAVSPRASTQEMDFLAQAVPNYNLPGTAPQTLVSELRGLSQYQVLKSNALPVYLQTIASQQPGNFQGTSLGFEKWWNTNGPSPSAIVIGSVVTHLPPQQRAAYVKRLQSTVTGRLMLQQYARARAFEAQFPGIFRGL